jgi:tetratricopeptide (TPR) repeat protein
MSGAGGPEAGRPGFRARRPWLARFLLYGPGLALVVAGVLLLANRRETDRADRLDYLRARLGSLDLVMAAGGADGNIGAQSVLRVLDEEFADADLPEDLRARALRVRGIAQWRRGDLALADAAFGEALAREASPRSRGGILVEWAETRAHLGSHVEALELLDRPDLPRDGALALLAATTRAYSLAQAGRREEGLQGLKSALAAIPAPPAGTAPDWVAMREWTYEDARAQAEAHLKAGAGPDPFRNR